MLTDLLMVLNSRINNG